MTDEKTQPIAGRETPTERLALLLHTIWKHEGGIDSLCRSTAAGFAAEFAEEIAGPKPALLAARAHLSDGHGCDETRSDCLTHMENVYHEAIGGYLGEAAAAPTSARGLDPDLDELSVWAVRYTLGRSTYAPHSVVDLLIRRIDSLRPQSLAVIARDIDEAEQRGGLGMNMDAAAWQRLRAVIRERAA